MIKKIFIPTADGQPKEIGIKDEVALGKAKDALKAAKLALDKAHAAIGKASDIEGDLGSISETARNAYNKADEALTKKQNKLTDSDDVTINGTQLSVTETAKRALFIDQWNAACGTYGKYDPVNAPDPQHPFYLNTLWLTYQEAIAVMHAKWGIFNDRAQCPNTIRTNIPNSYIYTHYAYSNDYVDMASMFASTKLKVLRLWPDNFYVDVDNISAAFIHSGVLEFIFGIMDMGKITETSKAYIAFKGCKALKEVFIRKLKINLSLSDSPLLSLSTMQYMVSNAANTTEITVTVHPDVYAKLTDESNAEWNAVLTSAEAKQITFATTN